MIQQFKSFGARIGGSAVLVATAAHTSFAAVNTTDPACNTDPNTGLTIQNGVNCTHPGGTPNDLFGQGGTFQLIANTLIFLVGAISVIMLIIGGLRYVLSSGEASAVKGAKDTILYAIIGIIVAILAFAIVSFVVSRFTVTP